LIRGKLEYTGVVHLGRSVVRPAIVDVMTDIVPPRAARLSLDLSFDGVGSGQALDRVTNTRTGEPQLERK
jgi:hypothetical protein